MNSAPLKPAGNLWTPHRRGFCLSLGTSGQERLHLSKMGVSISSFLGYLSASKKHKDPWFNKKNKLLKNGQWKFFTNIKNRCFIIYNKRNKCDFMINLNQLRQPHLGGVLSSKFKLQNFTSPSRLQVARTFVSGDNARLAIS